MNPDFAKVLSYLFNADNHLSFLSDDMRENKEVKVARAYLDMAFKEVEDWSKEYYRRIFDYEQSK